ncbi:MAG: hypothetical protein IIB05_09390 [Bacteroidetes bacterium]|nr:hypothetical protein [Bacteroidota bacterium]
MISSLFRLKFAKVLMLIIISALVVGCKSGEKGEKEPEFDVDMQEIDQSLFDNINQAKRVFYSMPSPLETAMLVRSAGAIYNEDLLNSLDNVGNYTTNRSMALNLGIYTCDLSFASLYDQTQTSISYLSAAKKMADGLGILDAINEETLERLEENVNNREVIMDIISETFMNSSAYLQENNRQALSSIVLVGGWVEGLYLAIKLVDQDSFEGNKLVDRIVDQKLSLNIVMKLLEDHKNNPDVADILIDMNQLKAIYDKISITTSEIKTSFDEETQITTLESTTKNNFTLEIFIELSTKVESLRETYIL